MGVIEDVGDALEHLARRRRHHGHRKGAQPRVAHVVEAGADRRVDVGGGQATVDEQRAQATAEELVQLAAIGVGDLDRARELVGRDLDQRVELDREAAALAQGVMARAAGAEIEVDRQDRVGGAAQPVGIRRAGGLEAGAEAADQGVDAIGDADQRAGDRRRQRRAGAARHVVLGDRRADRVGGRGGRRIGGELAPRVVHAHHALQLGQLADHAGQQIALAQLGGAVRDRATVVVLEADVLGQRVDDADDALDLVAGRFGGAELGLEHHVVELAAQDVEVLLAVVGEEEPRVGQPRREHALVAGAHDVGVLGDRAGDGRELRRQRAALLHREVALVVAHGGDQRLLRHLEEPGIEPAGDADRVLDQAGDLVDEIVVLAHGAAGLDREPRQLGLDHPPPRRGIDDHERSAQRVDVVGGAVERDRRRRQEAMTAGGAIGGEPAVAHRHDLAAVERDQPVQRAHEAHLAPAPAHRLGPRDRRDQVGEQLRQHLQRGLPGDVAGRHHVQALLAGDLGLLQRLRIDAVLGGEAEAGLGDRAVGRERGADRRADHALVEIGLAIDQTAHDHREATRRAQRDHVGGGQARGVEARAHEGRQLGDRPRQHARRDLLAAEFEQELVTGHGPPPQRSKTAATPREPRPAPRR